jgi:hypothetical protein
MQSDSTHIMITRSRATNQSESINTATVKPVTRSQTVKPVSGKSATVKPTTRSQTSVPSVVQEPRMVTRSSNNSPRYDVDIDFDEASDAWRANKKSIGNGMFKYVGMRTRSKM